MRRNKELIKTMNSRMSKSIDYIKNKVKINFKMRTLISLEVKMAKFKCKSTNSNSKKYKIK
jgi:hypothetical protein